MSFTAWTILHTQVTGLHINLAAIKNYVSSIFTLHLDGHPGGEKS